MSHDNKVDEPIAPGQGCGANSVSMHTPMMQQCVASVAKA
jgi:hypothetical protein